MSKVWILGRAFKYEFLKDGARCLSLDVIGDNFREFVFMSRALTNELQDETKHIGYFPVLKVVLLDTETLEAEINEEIELEKMNWFVDVRLKELGKLYFNLSDSEIRRIFFELKLESIDEVKSNLVKTRRHILSATFTFMFENNLKGSYFKEFNLDMDDTNARERMVNVFWFLREREIV